MDKLSGYRDWSKYKTDAALSGEFRPLYFDYLHLLLYAGFMLICGTLFALKLNGAAVYDVSETSFMDNVREVASEVTTVATHSVAVTATNLYDSVFEKVDQDVSPLRDKQEFLDYNIVKYEKYMDIEFSVANFFLSGHAELKPDGEKALVSLASKLMAHSKNAEFEFIGFTDSLPIVKSAWRYPTNWELSGARAARALRVFEAYGFKPETLSFKGYGQYHLKYAQRNLSSETVTEKETRNRRLIIRIHPKN